MLLLILMLRAGLSLHAGDAPAEAAPSLPDPPPPADLPAFWKSTLADVDTAVASVRAGAVATIAVSPGKRPVYAVTYGTKDDLRSRANYNSAVAAGNAAWYANKARGTRPAVFFMGPVHGQEIENIVGLVNLIAVAETGKDLRGTAWPSLRDKIGRCRVTIVPCANPDGRARCPYDSFRGIPTRTMTKYGQGTRRDGSLYGWPGAKAVHPMQGDVGILGAYFNDRGINPMHDDFFAPMAPETAALLAVARDEAPDLAVSLHSHENRPVVLQTTFVPLFVKRRIAELSERVKARYEREDLPYGSVLPPQVEDAEPPARSSFNLISAIHHVSGAMTFTFECCHGSVSERSPEPLVTYEQILQIQLCLYDEMLAFAFERQLCWELPGETKP
jgi:hypothetical protein